MSKQFKLISVALLVIVAAVVVTGLLVFPRTEPPTNEPALEKVSLRAQQLQNALNGADRIEVRPLMFDDETAVEPVVINDAEQIASFVTKLDFNDQQSGMYCMCGGDSLVRFYRGDTFLLELSHHHGISVRWHGGPWEGDSRFTAESAAVWRDWFKENGEPRFEAMHQEQVARANRDKANRERFLAVFKPEARAVLLKASFRELDEAEKAEGGPVLAPSAEALFDLYEDRGALAVTIAKALGVHAANGVGSGSWTQSGPEEGLILHAASALEEADFRRALDHDDPEVLLGAARLFLFKNLSRLIPEQARSGYAVKLCHAVLLHDRVGNQGIALRLVRRYPSDAVTDLFERVVSGEIEITAEDTSWDDDPAERYSALVYLASVDPARAKPHLPMLASQAEANQSNQTAVTIARSLCGETGLLDESVFKFSSYTLGLGALEALEKEGTKRALDVIITAGTDGNYAAVREEAVLTVERMTGKQWFMDRKHERAEWHGDDIRQWWAENKATFVMPER